MLALTCDVIDCRKPAAVWYQDGNAACKEHGTHLTTENNFGVPRHTLGFVMTYDESLPSCPYTGLVPRLPML